MKKLAFSILTLVIIGCGSYNIYFFYQNRELSNSTRYRVLIAYNKAYLESHGCVLEAYKSVLMEEGVPWEAVEICSLAATAAKKLAQTKPVIIFPDGLLQSMPEGMQAWSKDYLKNGGNLAIIYDAGVRTPKGYFSERALLADIVGINYITFSKLREEAYTTGCIRFDSKEDSEFFELPSGKISDRVLLSGYIYGNLNYSIARTEFLESIPKENIFAYAVTTEGDRYPAVVLKKWGKGNVLYVNLPIGYLKAYSDDLPLRSFMRTLLFRIVKIPHLLNTNGGKGGLVINWHIDSNIEWASIPEAIKNNVLNNDLHYSIHITAGNYLNKQGDGLGFDACGKGRDSAQRLLPFGTIGSHGGWAHNWFSNNLEKGNLSAHDIELYIKKNKACLESITGYPLLEYSAPNGVHPQPIVTEILEKLGFSSYYYTGDCGSAPNRTFYDGKMVSAHIIAFPVMPFGKSASLFEMKKNGLSERDMQQWLFALVDYTIQHRVTRLFYSHLHDISYYPEAMRNFLRYIQTKQSEGTLQIEAMSTFASFFQTFLKTELSCQLERNKLSIILKNEAGLKGLTVAVPRHKYRIETEASMSKMGDDNYYYLRVNEDVKEKRIILNCN
jgi:hypothetical protein